VFAAAIPPPKIILAVSSTIFSRKMTVLSLELVVWIHQADWSKKSLGVVPLVTVKLRTGIKIGGLLDPAFSPGRSGSFIGLGI
jgi:thiamine transporter ThiT